MIKMNVTGSVWSTKHIEGLPAGAFLEVESADGQHLVAFDVLGSSVGETVLVATGSAAAAWFAGIHPPIDALIIGAIDENNKA